MMNFPARWDERRTGTAPPVSGLRVVSGAAPRRPRWRVLYVAFAMLMAAGTGPHLLIQNTVLVTIADAVFGLALFATLVGWIRVNRGELSRLDEPDAGPGRARIRVVKSRVLDFADDAANHGIVRLEPEDRVVLPYDFR